MKTKKHKPVRLLAVKLGKQTKEPKMSTASGSGFNFDSVGSQPMKPPPPVKRKRPNTPYQPAEDQFIVEACKHNAPNGKCNREFLDALAKHLNLKFHEKKKQRTGESLWWHIHREQNKGNTYFAGIEISGNSRESKGQSQVIKSALKTPKVPSVKHKMNILPAPTATRTAKMSGGKTNYDIIIRDPLTGQTERLQTMKFGTAEEIILALT
jgi:hypothetical protein